MREFTSIIALLMILIIAPLVINFAFYSADKVIVFFEGGYETKEISYPVSSFDLKKEKETTMFFPKEHEYIIIQKEDGSTLTITPGQIEITKGETTEIVEGKEFYVNSGDFRQSTYTLLLSESDYASFAKEYAHTFNKDLE